MSSSHWTLPHANVRFIVASLIAVAIVGLVAGILAISVSDLLTAGSRQSNATALTSTPQFADLMGEMESGQKWSLSFSPELRTANVHTTLAWDSAEPVLQLLDKTSGQIVAEFHMSHSAVTLYRDSANQLLLSDSIKEHPDDSIPHEGTRLLVFDVAADGLSLNSEVPLPNRVRTAVYTHPLVFSADETTLVYARYDFALEGEECLTQGGAWAGQACDFFSLVSVNLTDFQLEESVALPTGCYPGVSAYGTSGFAVACLDQSVLLFNGNLAPMGTLDFSSYASQHEDAWGNSFSASLSFVGESLGSALGVFRDGNWVRLSGNSLQSGGRLLPESTWTAGTAQRLDEERIGIPYKRERTLGGVDGLVVFNLSTTTVEQQVEFHHADDAVFDESGNVILLREGVLSSLNARTDAEEVVGSVSSNAEVIIE